MAKTSFQRQIMEAGFGEMLQEFGFEKISTTHYRRVTDRVIWDQVTLPHTITKPAPRAFRDLIGATYQGLEELFAEFAKHLSETGWDYPPLLHKIPGKKLTAHRDYTVIAEYGQRDPEPLAYYAPQKPTNFFKALLWTPPKPQKFVQRHPDAVYGHSYLYWQIRPERDIREFTDEFCDYWVRGVWEVMQLDETPGGHRREFWTELSDQSINVAQALLLWIDGYHDLVLEAVERIATRPEETYDQVYQFYEDKGTFEEAYIFRQKKHREDLVQRTLQGLDDQIKVAQALNKTFENRR